MRGQYWAPIDRLTGWSPLERDRARNPNSPMVTLIDYLRAEGLDGDEERTVQRQYTTIERILENVAARKKLGLEVNAGVLCSLIGPDPLNAIMKALLAKVAATAAPSRALNKAGDIEAFVDDLPSEVLPDPATFAGPVALKALRDHYKPVQPSGPDGPDGPAPPSPSPGPQPVPPSPKPRPPAPRKTLFRKGEVPASESRARAVLAELVTLQHKTHPTAVTVLFRVFLERTVREYVERHKIPISKKGSHEKISDYIIESFNHFDRTNPGAELGAIRRVVKAGLSGHHVDVLNRVLHDRFAFASAADIENIADVFRDFLIALWTSMR